MELCWRRYTRFAAGKGRKSGRNAVIHRRNGHYKLLSNGYAIKEKYSGVYYIHGDLTFTHQQIAVLSGLDRKVSLHAFPDENVDKAEAVCYSLTGSEERKH